MERPKVIIELSEYEEFIRLKDERELLLRNPMPKDIIIRDHYDGYAGFKYPSITIMNPSDESYVLNNIIKKLDFELDELRKVYVSAVDKYNNMPLRKKIARVFWS
jgi:hypothetical protein